MTRLSPIRLLFIGALFFAFALASCTRSAELGTADNPVKLYFVPSVDAKLIDDNSKAFKDFFEKQTGYKFEVAVPQSYIAVVEAFGTRRCDISALNTFGYIKAHEKFGAEARLTVVRRGEPTYQSQFITRANSQIKTIKDLDGKKIAFVDPASASGYLLPMKTLKSRGIKPKETVFAMTHDSVVSMVYQGQVDAGATFYSPPYKGEIADARYLVKAQYPDVEKKIRIIELSDPIPNDPIVFRKDMPEEMKEKIVNAFFEFLKTPEGKKAFKEIYDIDSLQRATDKDYDAVRAMLTSLGTSADDLMRK